MGPPLLAAFAFRSLLYHPTRLTPDELSSLAAAPGWTTARVEVTPGLSLNGLLRHPEDPAREWILYFGGNAMDLASIQWVLGALDGGRGYGLAAFAYRGYDGSGGRPSEAALFADASAVSQWLERAHGVRPERLVLAGQSLGSGVAAHLAAALGRSGRPPRAVVLVSPYSSMPRVVNDLFPLPLGWAIPERFATDELVDTLAGPVLLLHGTEDTLIRPAHSRRLAEKLGARSRLVLLEGRGHNDLWSDPRTAAEVRALLDEGR